METCASTPFDHAKADIILRSADGVEFRVFTLFLSLASPFFETLFGLPQAPGGAADQEIKDGLAVITVSEDSKTLDSFLRFCYPSTLAEDPSFENLTDALSVLAAARKYSLDLIERKVSGSGESQAGLIHRNHSLTHLRARIPLGPLIPAWCEEIDLITAADLLALLKLPPKICKKVCIAVQKRIVLQMDYRSLSQIMSACNWLFVLGRLVADGGDDRRFSLWSSGPVTWWITYMQEVFELLMDSPSGDTVRTAADRTVEKVRAAGCTVCSGKVKEGMAEFSNLLAQRVEEVVASVCIYLALYHGSILISQ
ncbi:hypothetical protein EDB19DRAFT_1643905 [Suillus lakei]|nr:hypothetical protein EDB19DRAFT_1643905 [Suillus lakei]